MMKRSEDMAHGECILDRENYAIWGFLQLFFIFDEYVAFMEMLGTKENAAVLNKLNNRYA